MDIVVHTRSDFSDYCSVCGLALTQYEITADIQGNLVLFDEKTTGSIQITLCADCKNKLLEYSVGGLDAAINRRLGIDERNAVNVRRTRAKTKVKSRKKDGKDDKDDGSGGVKPLLP